MKKVLVAAAAVVLAMSASPASAAPGDNYITKAEWDSVAVGDSYATAVSKIGPSACWPSGQTGRRQCQWGTDMDGVLGNKVYLYFGETDQLVYKTQERLDQASSNGQFSLAKLYAIGDSPTVASMHSIAGPGTCGRWKEEYGSQTYSPLDPNMKWVQTFRCVQQPGGGYADYFFMEVNGVQTMSGRSGGNGLY